MPYSSVLMKNRNNGRTRHPSSAIPPFRKKEEERDALLFSDVMREGIFEFSLHSCILLNLESTFLFLLFNSIHRFCRSDSFHEWILLPGSVPGTVPHSSPWQIRYFLSASGYPFP